jgi:hypothetical protein
LKTQQGPLKNFMETVEEVLKGERHFDEIPDRYHEQLVAYFVTRGCTEKDAEQKALLLCIATQRDWLEILSLARIDPDDETEGLENTPDEPD